MKKNRILIAAAIFLTAFTVVGGFLLWEATFRPEILDYGAFFEKPAGPDSKVTVTFFGSTTLLIDDGETAFMTDGFFSRPSRFSVVTGNLAPDEEVIKATLEKFEIQKLAAVIPLHTHFDHALDSAAVAVKTGALLVGSESAARLGRGYGMDGQSIRVVRPGDQMTFGKFRVTFIASAHSPPERLAGHVEWNVKSPARVWEYKAGEVFSILVEHEERKFLVHASTNFIHNALKDFRAETVYLGVGTLGKQEDTFRSEYWNETVRAVGARKVVLIHWDNFFRPLDEPLRLQSYTVDDFNGTMDFLKAAGAKDQADIRIPVFGQAADPFSR